MAVHIGECFKKAPTFYSRACDSHFVYPSPAKSPEKFVIALAEYSQKIGSNVILPLNSAETLALAEYRTLLPESLRLPFGDYSTMLRLHTKHEVIKLAESLDIAVPKTEVCCRISDVDPLAEKVGFPIVMKPTQSTSSRGVSYHSNLKSLRKAFAGLQQLGMISEKRPVLIQEKISGPGCGTSVLMNRGRPVAAASHLRLHEYPLHGGPSTYRVSISNQEMEGIAFRLLEAVGWHGLAMVEFKLDSKTQKPILMEVNPRVWGSIFQSIAAGINFPVLAVRLALGEDITGFEKGRVGVRTMCLLNEMRVMISSIFHLRWTIIEDLLQAPFFPIKFDIFSIKDPLPFFRFLGTGMGLFSSREEK